jgi:hypothetical protein
MRALDLVLSYLVTGDVATSQRVDPPAPDLAHRLSLLHSAAPPAGDATTASTAQPRVSHTPGRRRSAALGRGSGLEGTARRVLRPLPPAVFGGHLAAHCAPGLYSHAHAMLLARYRAHPSALDALSPAVAAAVLRALDADGDGVAQPAAALLDAGGQAADEDVDRSSSPQGPMCSICLEPVLDGRGHLVQGTVALVQATSQGVLHAHLYRGAALATWLRSGSGHSHPETRAAVDVTRHVHPLC